MLVFSCQKHKAMSGEWKWCLPATVNPQKSIMYVSHTSTVRRVMVKLENSIIYRSLSLCSFFFDSFGFMRLKVFAPLFSKFPLTVRLNTIRVWPPLPPPPLAPSPPPPVLGSLSIGPEVSVSLSVSASKSAMVSPHCRPFTWAMCWITAMAFSS